MCCIRKNDFHVVGCVADTIIPGALTNAGDCIDEDQCNGDRYASSSRVNRLYFSANFGFSGRTISITFFVSSSEGA